MRLAFWLRSPFRHLTGVAQRARTLLPPRRGARIADAVAAHAPTEQRPRPAARLRVEVVEMGEAVVVRLRGEAGVAEVDILEASLLQLLARRPPWVTFDLSELRLIASLAMGVLESHRRAAVRAGLVADLHPPVREALTKANLLGRFEPVGAVAPDTEPGPFARGARPWYPTVYDAQRTYGVTWNELVELEPQLATLLWRARMAVAKCSTLADVLRVFGPVRDDLAGLIGFAGKHRGHPVLGSSAAYAVAYWKLYDAVARLLPRRQGGAE